MIDATNRALNPGFRRRRMPRDGEGGIGLWPRAFDRLLRRDHGSPGWSSGRVTGIEYEPELAARAKANFAAYPNVDIVESEGALVSFDQADVIHVNAGCTRPSSCRFPCR
jgi:hypothetical protein